VGGLFGCVGSQGEGPEAVVVGAVGVAEGGSARAWVCGRRT